MFIAVLSFGAMQEMIVGSVTGGNQSQSTSHDKLLLSSILYFVVEWVNFLGIQRKLTLCSTTTQRGPPLLLPS